MKDSKYQKRWAPSSRKKRRTSRAQALLETLQEVPLPRLVAMGALMILLLWGLWTVLAPASIKVKKTIRSMESSVSTENYWRCCTLLSNDFVAQGDPYDIQDAKAGLWVIFRDYDGFQVELPIQNLEIQGKKATVDTHFTLSYWPSGIPERQTTIEGDLTLFLKPSWWGWKICGVDLDESLISSFRW